MKVIDARIDWYKDFANRPALEILVDRMVPISEMRYDEVKFRGGDTAVFAEKDGAVHFFYHSIKDQTGFGGSTFTITTLDGEVKAFKGPWSSNSFSMYSLFGIPCAEVRITDDPEAFARGYTFMAGYISGRLFEETMQRFFPEVGWVFAGWKGEEDSEEMGYDITKPKNLPAFKEGRTVQYKGRTTYHALGRSTVSAIRPHIDEEDEF